jgi:flagellar protein FliS
MNVGTDQNPYQAYTDGSIFSESPLSLVVALYQGALDATSQAETAIQGRDIPTRTKAINKAIAILSELTVSLDLERGGEIAESLRRLYSYMQERLLNAHIRQAAEPIVEVSKLLTTLLEGWRGAQAAATRAMHASFESTETRPNPVPETHAPVYGGYLEEALANAVNSAYSF